MGTRTKGAPRTGPSETSPADSGVPAGDAGSVVDGTVEDSPAQPTAGSPGPWKPTVHGEPVSELMLLMKQGEQGWLLQGKAGNHEFARAFYMDDGKGTRYMVGQGGVSRLGPSELWGIDIDARGATFHWSTGLTSWIPSTWYQLSYR